LDEVECISVRVGAEQVAIGFDAQARGADLATATQHGTARGSKVIDDQAGSPATGRDAQFEPISRRADAHCGAPRASIDQHEA
jgi:hypothetical protein